MTPKLVVWVNAALLVIIAAVLVITHAVGSAEPPVTLAWWYDMGTGELYGASGQGLPPEVAPSGAEAVKAVVYAEKDCADPTDRFIVYLWKFTPQGKQRILKPATEPGCFLSLPEMLVKTPDEDEWVLRTAEDRRELIAAAEAKRGAKLSRCLKYE